MKYVSLPGFDQPALGFFMFPWHQKVTSHKSRTYPVFLFPIFTVSKPPSSSISRRSRIVSEPPVVIERPRRRRCGCCIQTQTSTGWSGIHVHRLQVRGNRSSMYRSSASFQSFIRLWASILLITVAHSLVSIQHLQPRTKFGSREHTVGAWPEHIALVGLSLASLPIILSLFLSYKDFALHPALLYRMVSIPQCTKQHNLIIIV